VLVSGPIKQIRSMITGHEFEGTSDAEA